ncbi:MAG: hypothetical protein ABIS86_03540, partial [Streptosporangiaceae bacterium]
MRAHQGTGKLIRLILRRDRWLLPVWVVLLAGYTVSLTSSIDKLYPTGAERLTFIAETAGTGSYMAMFGPAFGSGTGALGAQRATSVLVIVAVINLLTAVRHTRTEEEAGRRELLAATPIGRQAPVSAVLAVLFCADLVLGLLVALGMTSLDSSVAGAFALGLEVTLAGWIMAAVGVFLAQVCAGARIARGIGFAALAGVYLLRMAGDAGGDDGGASWLWVLSPIAWLQRVRAYADERWWLFLPALALVLVLTAGAYALSARRDIGAGLLQPRLGPAEGSAYLGGPLGLAWRLHRGLLIAWSFGFAVAGAVFGGLAQSADTTVGDNQRLQDILDRMGGQGAFSDSFLAAMTSLIGVIAAGYAVQTVFMLRSEEAGQRAEPVLSLGVSRLRWAAGHLTFTILGTSAALLSYGLFAGLTYGTGRGDLGGELPRVLGAALVQLPAVWTVAAVTLLCYGLLPRLTAVAWAAPVLCLVFGQFGAIFKLDQWVLDISPFTHVPRLPGGHVSATSLVVLLAIALILGAAGLIGFRRRDIPI